MKKREFIKICSLGMCGILTGAVNAKTIIEKTRKISFDLDKWTKEAYYYKKTAKGVKCQLCPNNCGIKNEQLSDCKNRVCVDGKLYSIAYGNPCAVHVDPIEKKPLNHFLPTSYSYSIATAGCNFTCLNCQNWQISQFSPRETQNQDLMPDKVVEKAIANDCKSISYTYSEPITFYEYMFDTAKKAKEKKIKNVLVSNGYINETPLKELCKYIDAANIDLKSFSDEIFNQSILFLEGVIEGFCQGDGHWDEKNRRWRIRIKYNPLLISQLETICLLIGKQMRIENNKKINGFGKEWKISSFSIQGWDKRIIHRDISYQAIRKITKIGVKKVYDLEIEPIY
ncbi:MAG: radical SAM protein, partial [Candidatus Pacearchaeota archaeon]